MRGRVSPLMLLLGILVLASVSATHAKSSPYQKKTENPCAQRCLQSCQQEPDDLKQKACESRCTKLEYDPRCVYDPRGHTGTTNQRSPPGERTRGRQPGDYDDDRRQPRREEGGRWGPAGPREREREEDWRQPREDWRQFQNLQNHRIVQIEAKPNTLVLPKHADADNILVIQQGQATVTVANGNNRKSFNLDEGHALRIPSGFISYILNRHDNQNLRVAKISMPVNTPGQFEDFFPASSRDQSSYLQGFSRNTLEAAFNAEFNEIRRVLLEENAGGEQEERGQRRWSTRSSENNEGVIVKVSKEHVEELTKHAKSVSKKGSEEEGDITNPINLREGEPDLSNNFGKLFEVKPDKKNPQLQDLDMMLTCVEIKEGALMLPHFNSKAMVIVVVNKGTGNLELVAVRKEQQQRGRREEEEDEDEEEEGSNREVRRYTARLKEGDVFIMPAAHPVAINASSELHLLGFGINAENNHRIFLAGDKDNVIDQIEKQAKDLAFPGSGEQVEKLIKNQKESHFVSARPQSQSQSPSSPEKESPEKEDQEEENQGGKGPLLSILKAFN
ncbi:Allergen Ara h 1, clone P41B [Arachis hypogaea]|uniref:Allergen Ara h 1, clone P41B n=1 Tax=Arachis hypogaea TaxID=3818 RepID=A0A6B9VEU6_ARAHY|nr:Allergen Ara h 1, clone P41B [Arachis hypogaea]